LKKCDIRSANYNSTCFCRYVYISCTRLSSWLQYNSQYVALEVWGVSGSKQKFGCKSMDDKGGGLVIYSVVHVASGDDYR